MKSSDTCPAKKYHFVHCTSTKGRRPKDKRTRKNIHRHVMFNHLAEAATMQNAGKNDTADFDDHEGLVLCTPPLMHPCLRSPHPLNAHLDDLRIPGLSDFDSVWKWHSLSDLSGSSCEGWVAEAQHIWGRVLWDTSTRDPLIFYTHLQILLDKIATVTSTSQDAHVCELASKTLSMLNERLADPESLSGDEIWSIASFIHLAVRSGDYETARLHMKGIQLLLDLRDANRYVWNYAYFTDLRLAGILRCKPMLRKHFDRSKWPPQVTLSREQAFGVAKNTERYIRACGQLPIPFPDLFRSCLAQLLACEVAHASGVFNVVSQTEGLYSLLHHVCLLHGLVCEELSDDRRESVVLFELIVLTLKLCAWALCRQGNPQSGEGPKVLVKRASDLLQQLPRDKRAFRSLVDDHKLDPCFMLWILFIQYAEAQFYWPSLQVALYKPLESVTERIGFRTPADMSRKLCQFPCVQLFYQKRLGFACREFIAKKNPRWQRIEECSPTPKGSPLTGFVAALRFELGEARLD